MPDPSPRPGPDPALATAAATLAARLAPLATPDALALLAREFRGRIALVSSFGADAAVLLHLVSRADPAMPVLFLDTGKLFPETLEYRDALVARLGLSDVRSLAPDPAALAARDPAGRLWSSDPDGCCGVRKVDPLEAGLAGFALSLNGRKRFQAATRAALPLAEPDAGGRLKATPLAAWGADDLEAYRAAHDLPTHPLVAYGYPSIGCMPCTGRVAPGEDARAGRWRGSAKTECGIHRPAAAPSTAAPSAVPTRSATP